MGSGGSHRDPFHPDALEQVTRTGRAPLRLALRWVVGMALMGWRYLRDPVPVPRTEAPGDEGDRPPPVDAALLDERSQPAEDGHGPLFHRRFRVLAEGATLDAATLMERIAADLSLLLPREVAAVSPRNDAGGPGPGDEFVVRMPGPWDGPVRVVLRDTTRLRLATLAGHLEAGQIEFRAVDDEAGLRFEIETWARPGTRWVDVLYTHLRLAKEMQLYLWVRACVAAARIAGGRPRHGVEVRTRRLELR